jgi:hypothetical protein
VIFPDRTSYAQVRESGVLSRESVCRMFGIAAAQIQAQDRAIDDFTLKGKPRNGSN